MCGETRFFSKKLDSENTISHDTRVDSLKLI